MFRSFAVVVVSLGLLAGCGGKVVFVEDDGSGANGSGGAGPGPGPGPGPGQTNSSTGSSMPTTCQQFCNVYGACVENCLGACDPLFTGQCDNEVSALLACFINAFDGGCEPLNDSCQLELEAYAQCQNGNQCFTDSCEQDPEGCFCKGFCNNGQQLDQQCFTFPDGGPPPPGGQQPATCDCYLDGNYIGSCDTAGFECSIEEGCCQQLVGGFK